VSHRRVEPGVDPLADGDAPSLEALSEDILPALVARLRASRLGELEVRADGWRVRLRRAPAAPGPLRAAVTVASGDPGEVAAVDLADARHSLVRSPAVGYVSLGADLVVGRSVQAGDTLGSVDVLGVRQDVAAPGDGVISRVLVEDDQAVEYGQVLAHVDPLGPDAGPGEVEPAADAAAGTEPATALRDPAGATD